MRPGAGCIRLPGAGLLGPMALTVVLAGHRAVVRPLGADGAGSGRLHGDRLAGRGGLHPRIALRAVGRLLPAAIALIVVLGVATAGLGVVLADVAGITPLEGYLATSPGGVYAVLATAVETGSNVTFIIAAQVLRVLLMLFAAPLLARIVIG